MTSVLTPNAKQQFLDNSGRPANGFKVFTYAAGTTTKIATKDGPSGANNPNPIILNYRGEADVWIEPNVAYKYVLAPPTSPDPPTSPIWTRDNIVSSQLITLYGGVDTGSANAYVLTFTANFSALTDGIVIYWVPANTNTLSSTLNVNGLGAVALVRQDGSALTGGEVLSGQIAQVIYRSGSFRLIGSVPVSGVFTGVLTGVVGTVSATCQYTVSGRIVSVRLPNTLSGTSNATACTITGMPTFLSPGSGMTLALPDSGFLNNSVVVNTVSAVVTGVSPGIITFLLAGNATGFNAANGKGINNTLGLTWMLP